jgi:hypothetical protein
VNLGVNVRRYVESDFFFLFGGYEEDIITSTNVILHVRHDIC